jgi:hypothetical protein
MVQNQPVVSCLPTLMKHKKGEKLAWCSLFLVTPEVKDISYTLWISPKEVKDLTIWRAIELLEAANDEKFAVAA